MVAAVRHGGWVCIEESDFFSFRSADESDPRSAVFDKAMDTMCAALQASGMSDPYFGRRTGALLEAAGLESVESDGILKVARGADPVGRFWHLTYQLPGASRTVEAGLLTRDEFDLAMALFADPTFEFITTTRFGAWGRKPA